MEIELTPREQETLKRYAAKHGLKDAAEALHALLEPYRTARMKPAEKALTVMALLAPDSDIRSSSRNEHHVMLRAIAAEYMRNQGMSLMEIARYLNRHHATIMNNLTLISQAERFPDSYPILSNMRRQFQEKLRMLEETETTNN